MHNALCISNIASTLQERILHAGLARALAGTPSHLKWIPILFEQHHTFCLPGHLFGLQLPIIHDWAALELVHEFILGHGALVHLLFMFFFYRLLLFLASYYLLRKRIVFVLILLGGASLGHRTRFVHSVIVDPLFLALAELKMFFFRLFVEPGEPDPKAEKQEVEGREGDGEHEPAVADLVSHGHIR